MFLRRFFCAAIALIALHADARAQLRPLDPIDYRALQHSGTRLEIGAGAYTHQPAALAGTTGTLYEIGNFRLQFHTGRVVLDFGGTAQRVFHEKEVWAEPYADAVPPPADHKRHDAGDYRAATVVRLTADNSATVLALRFGTRLPTTDNRVGLDRDATDFFATLGGRRAFRGAVISAEAGLSINGTRKTTYEQSDVLVYAVTTEFNGKRLSPYVTALGQEDLHTRVIRGNEDLGELRIGVRTQGSRWLNAAWVHGYSSFSPHNGVQISFGQAFH